MKRDPRTTRQSYFNFAFRYERKAFGGAPVTAFRDALAAELDVATVEPCYVPLNDCSLYRPLTKKRYHISAAYWKAIDPSRFKLPVCEDAYKNTSVTFHHSVLMAKKSGVDLVAEAIVKIQENASELR